MLNIANLKKEDLGKFFEGGKSIGGNFYWTPECIQEGLAKVKKYGFRSYIGSNESISYAKKELEGTGIHVLGIFSFPSGNICMETKKAELEYVIKQGADTCDGCLSMSHIKSNQWDLVKREANEIVEFAKKLNPKVEIKLIVEFEHVTDEELMKSAQIIYESGADFIKTCTGWKGGNVTARQIRMVHDAFPTLKIKGSSQLLAFGLSGLLEVISAGATCVGTSNIEKCLADWDLLSGLRNL